MRNIIGPSIDRVKGDYQNLKQLGETQDCPQCGFQIGTRAGSKEAVCTNCGYKDPCCE